MPCGHPGLPLRATAWAGAGRDGRMALTIRRLQVDILRRTRRTIIDS
jgi:hypothetical protein